VKLHTDLAGDGQVVWHPTDPQRAWSVGVGDIVTATIDGGKHWTWANNGNSGLMLGSTFTFNTTAPDTLYIGSQDYNGALTATGGATWEHVNLSRFRFGYVYGGYAAGPDLLFGGNGGHWGGKRKLFVMRGGNAPENVTDTGIELDGYPVCAGDPTAPNVLFAYNQRSTNRAATWSPMSGCDGVMTAMPSGTKALIGRNRKSLVSSIDHGATWTSIAELTSDISDIAVDTKRSSFLVVAGEHLWRVTHGTSSDITNDIPADQFGNHRIITFAIDPQDPEIQYVGSRKDIYHYDGSVAMSHDGGATWSVITRSARLGVNNVGPDGGGEPQWIRVHPQSHSLYVGTNCYGMWRFNPKR